MRNIKWLAAAVLVASTTGCVESVNQGYGYNQNYAYNGGGYNGYSNSSYPVSSGYYPASSGYYPSSSGYYSRPAVNNYYYNPQPQVVTQTRYVPVPTPSGQADRWNDHRWGGRHDDNQQHHHQSPQAQNNNPTPTPGTGGGNHHNGGNSRWDKDGDGKPDRRG